MKNRLAHGGDDVVTNDELAALREAFAPFHEDINLDNWDEHAQLQIIVSGIWQATGHTVAYAFEKRAETEAAVAEWWANRSLSAEQIRELLEGDETLDAEA